MEDLVDLIATDSASADISDKIKDALFTKSANRIDTLKPEVAVSMFDQSDTQPEVEPETEVEPEEPTDGE